MIAELMPLHVPMGVSSAPFRVPTNWPHPSRAERWITGKGLLTNFEGVVLLEEEIEQSRDPCSKLSFIRQFTPIKTCRS